MRPVSFSDVGDWAEETKGGLLTENYRIDINDEMRKNE